MAQHDYVIDNQTGANFRADLNNALDAVKTNNSGSSAPSTNSAGQLWLDTSATNNLLKVRDQSTTSTWHTLMDIQSGKLTVSSASLDGAVTINESGADVDFRVESDTDTHALFVEGSSGRVGIGVSSPVSKLDIESPSSNPLLSVSRSSGAFNSAITFKTNTANDVAIDGGGSGEFLRVFTGGSERMRIDSSGAITMPDVYNDTVTGRDLYISSSGLLGYVSSVRESKTNIENLPDISWLYQLNPVKFQYRVKDEEENYTDEADKEIQYGLIAEDVAEVNPDLVFGDETENGFELRGIQYSRLIAPMLKAIQEQRALIDSQQAQIDALSARLDALENPTA